MLKSSCHPDIGGNRPKVTLSQSASGGFFATDAAEDVGCCSIIECALGLIDSHVQVTILCHLGCGREGHGWSEIIFGLYRFIKN